MNQLRGCGHVLNAERKDGQDDHSDGVTVFYLLSVSLTANRSHERATRWRCNCNACKGADVTPNCCVRSGLYRGASHTISRVVVSNHSQKWRCMNVSKSLLSLLTPKLKLCWVFICVDP